MFLLALEEMTGEVRGSSTMTVFRPTEEMSRRRSTSENMLEHRAFITTSVWLSLIFFTRGPRLEVKGQSTRVNVGGEEGLVLVKRYIGTQNGI